MTSSSSSSSSCSHQTILVVVVLIGSLHPIVDGFTAGGPLQRAAEINNNNNNNNNVASSSSTSTQGRTTTSSLFSGSSSSEPPERSFQRARIEHELEELMDNDWRYFRAKLVAQERAESGQQLWGTNDDHTVSTKTTTATKTRTLTPSSASAAQRRATTTTSSSSSSPSSQQQQQQPRSPLSGGDMPSSSTTDSNTPTTTNTNEKGLEKQSQLGDLFAGAISSIFRRSPGTGNNNKSNNNNNAATDSTQEDSSSTESNNNNNDDNSRMMSIFGEGENIGGMAIEELLDSNEDPFISEAELPLLLKPRQSAYINKQRWAHPLPHVENGCVLIANERLGGEFKQTVVLLMQHCEKNGSIGVVINRPYDDDLLKIGSEKDSKLDVSLKRAFASSTVTYGGPVLADEYSVLHGYGPVDGSTKVCCGVYVGGSNELIDAVWAGSLNPNDGALFCKGHAAWVGGQLDREISKGVWYPAAVSSNFILKHAVKAMNAQTDDDDEPSTSRLSSDGGAGNSSGGANELWCDILTCMGGQFADIARTYAKRGRLMP